jgi:hypothetical protein
MQGLEPSAFRGNHSRCTRYGLRKGHQHRRVTSCNSPVGGCCVEPARPGPDPAEVVPPRFAAGAPPRSGRLPRPGLERLKQPPDPLRGALGCT